ncbi:MAG: hypothetical protein J3Q66DRAFT_328263 [Benniella sp.]|nr:MAG: hypothetical protein J3Q66DRAFT_328263 [Benniella sp.]
MALATVPRRALAHLLFLLCLLSFSSLHTAHANLLGNSVAKLSYDRITLRNNPSSVDTADTIAPGENIPAGIISQTGSLPRDGFSGILYDMGYACTTEFDPTTTLPPPEFFGLPKIALIRRGSPSANQTCTFRTKLLNAQKNNSIAAIVYNGEAGMSLDYATAALESDESPLNIPGMLITLEDGTMLRTLLEQTQGGSGTETLEYYNRVRVKLAVEHKPPVIWEFILIVVVVLLAVSFAISVVLHCRLYALRQRIRMDALARGADVLPNGTIRMRKVTMNKVALEDLPVRVYSSTPAPEAGAGTSAGVGTDKEKAISTAAATAEASSSSSAEASGSNTHKGSTSLSRNNSKRSISSKSIRSLKAIESATALDAAAAADTIQQNPSPQPASAVAHGLDDISSDTCAVCLDEFSDGEELRTLPCHHEFHVECIDPWLIRKSSTCPLCKYDCLPRTTEELEGRGEDANIVVPNDRLMEFIMGPDWVAARTSRGHNGTSRIDRIGHFFGVLYDRIRLRPPRPFPGATVSGRSATTSLYQESIPATHAVQLDAHGQVPLQLITPRGVSMVPTISTRAPSTSSRADTSSAAESGSPSVVIDIPAKQDDTTSSSKQ